MSYLTQDYFAGMAVSLRNAIALGEDYVIKYVQQEIKLAHMRGMLEALDDAINRATSSTLGFHQTALRDEIAISDLSRDAVSLWVGEH